VNELLAHPEVRLGQTLEVASGVAGCRDACGMSVRSGGMTM
jgi:hypothetical protein